MKRIDWIDYAKGLGIILMVIGHYQYLNSDINKWIFSFHMPLFFLISGFLTSSKNIEYGKYIIKRFKQLFIPFFLFGFITYLLSFIVGKSYPIQEFILNIFNNRGAGMWFLHTLFLVNILYLFLYKLRKIKKIIIWIILIITSYFSSQYNIHLPLRAEVIPICLSFFLLGDILKPEILKMEKLNNYALYTFSMLSLSISFLLVTLSNRMDIAENRTGGYLFVITAIAGIIPILSLSIILDRLKSYCSYIKNILKFCSINAIIILIFHPYIFSFINKLFVSLRHNPDSIIAHFCVIIAEFIILYPLVRIINKYLPFLLGKWY